MQWTGNSFVLRAENLVNGPPYLSHLAGNFMVSGLIIMVSTAILKEERNKGFTGTHSWYQLIEKGNMCPSSLMVP